MKNLEIIDRLRRLDHISAIYLAIFVVIPHRCIVVVLNSGKMVSIFYRLQDNA